MPSKNLTTLINSPKDYSAGVLQNDFTWQWHPTPSKTFVLTTGTEKVDRFSNILNAIVRAYCHYVVNELPERALPELLETLEAMVDFYPSENQDRAELGASLGKLKLMTESYRPYLSAQKILPPVEQGVRVKVGLPQVRPEFHAVEE